MSSRSSSSPCARYPRGRRSLPVIGWYSAPDDAHLGQQLAQRQRVQPDLQVAVAGPARLRRDARLALVVDDDRRRPVRGDVDAVDPAADAQLVAEGDRRHVVAARPERQLEVRGPEDRPAGGGEREVAQDVRLERPRQRRVLLIAAGEPLGRAGGAQLPRARSSARSAAAPASGGRGAPRTSVWSTAVVDPAADHRRGVGIQLLGPEQPLDEPAHRARDPLLDRARRPRVAGVDLLERERRR